MRLDAITIAIAIAWSITATTAEAQEAAAEQQFQATCPL